MPDYSTASVADLQARITAHEADKSRAERRRSELAGARAEALLVLTVDEVLEIDADLARAAVTIERAAAFLALLGPALATAEVREAAAGDRTRETAERADFAARRSAAVPAHGLSLAATRPLAQALLAANGPVVANYNPALFDEKLPPRATYGDTEEWHRDREARLQVENRPSEPLRG